MPEIIQIAGLEDGVEEPQNDITTALITAAVGIGAVVVFGVLVPYLLGANTASTLNDLGIIKQCRAKDMKKGRARRAQKWCLWDSKGKRVLGRHPSRSRALRQERLIQVRKHGG